MPLRHICITTAVLQFFSFVTFLSLWGSPGEEFTSDGQLTEDRLKYRSLITTDVVGKKRLTLDEKRDPLAKLCLNRGHLTELCPKFFMGDMTIDNPMKLRYAVPPRQCKIAELLKDCSKLRRAHEYDVKPITSGEREFPLAFAIKMHRDPEQAEILLRTIYRPHNVYCIYVDRKSPKIVYNIMEGIGRCFENVFVVRERLNIVYASYAHAQSDLQCMKILKNSNVNWKYYINLTGQEFPLKTNLEMVEILKALNGANDIETYSNPVFMQWRYNKRFYTSGINLVETSQNKSAFTYKIPMSKGSAYGSFSREFVDFLLSDKISQEFFTWMNDTYSPEEHVWATLNTLPWAPGGYELEIRHRYETFLSRAINWENDKPECHGKYVRGVCVFSIGDLPWLVGRPQLIANKFDMRSDPMILTCLEDLMRNRTIQPMVHTQNWYYYRNLPHALLYSRKKIYEFSKEYRQEKKSEWLRNQRKNTVDTELKGRTEKPRMRLSGGSISIYTVRR